MSKYKKVIALSLSIIFALNILPIPAFAINLMSDNAKEKLEFIRSSGILVGEVISVSESNDEIDFSVNYLPNDKISHIIYKEDGSDVIVIVDEGNVSDEIVFKNNGEVYIDGVRDYTYSSENMVAPVTQYASAFFDDVPPGCTGKDFGGGKTTSDYMELGQKIANYAAGTLATKIAIAICGSTLNSALFVGAATILVDYAIDYAVTATGLSYTISTRKDTTEAPLQYYYEHYSSFKVGSKVATKLFYETETLI